MLFSILAEFDPNWNDLSIPVRKDFLLHLLDAGHRKIELNDAFGPIVGTGGLGQYIAMPIITKKAQAQDEQKSEQVEPTQTDVKPKVQTEQSKPQPDTEATESVTITNHTSNKEPSKMETNTNIRIVSAPVQTPTQNNEPEKELNPFDELTANIEAMKAKLKAMLDESAIIARKVREVAISQRQKEREYQQTKRTLERVRVATGAA